MLTKFKHFHFIQHVISNYLLHLISCSFDCGLFVPLYIKAIIHGVDTTQVTNHSDESEVIRARLVAELLIEGWEQKNQGETVEKDG